MFFMEIGRRGTISATWQSALESSQATSATSVAEVLRKNQTINRLCLKAIYDVKTFQLQFESVPIFRLPQFQ
jgi:hypothetical protein